MKKIIAILMLVVLIIIGFKIYTETHNEVVSQINDEEKIDYSEYLFVNVIWSRDNGNDIETIVFNADGSFSYFCACGNPVNDSDLCEGYRYNDETKEITFQCFETTEEMVTSVKIIEISDDILELDFNGEIRKFKKEN